MRSARRQLEDIHTRIVAGDPAASSDLFSFVHRALSLAMFRKFRAIGFEAAHDFATDAIVSYLQAPDRFSPERGSLFSWLCMIAKGDVLNHITSQAALKKNFSRFVELEAAERNVIEHGGDRSLEARRILERHISEIADDEADLKLLMLILQGERHPGHSKSARLGPST